VETVGVGSCLHSFLLRLTNRFMLRFAFLVRIVQMEDFLGSGRHRQQYLLDTYYRSEKPRQHEDGPVDGLSGSNAERMWKAADGFVRRAEQGLLKGVINLCAAIDTLLSGVER